jgi:hypothetical protein
MEMLGRPPVCGLPVRCEAVGSEVNIAKWFANSLANGADLAIYLL